MPYAPVSSKILRDLRQILGDDCVFTDPETLDQHSSDQAEKLRFLPEVVVKPRDVEGVSELMKICHREQLLACLCLPA